MMSPDTMTSTPGDPQEMNKMDTSESSAPLDDIPSSVDERMKRKNPFDDDEDEDSNKSAETKATNESSIEKQMNDFSEARTVERVTESSQNMETEDCNDSSADGIPHSEKSVNHLATSEENDDVAKFGGKIVYNPDGSAYIIEDEAGEDSELQLPKQEGSTTIDCSLDKRSETNDLPAIANAFFVSKSSAYFNALYGRAYVKMLQEKNVPETPICHSYRVYSVKDKSDGVVKEAHSSPSSMPSLPIVVPVKPILMCFICKLSFGCAKSFVSHCSETHSLELSPEELSILDPSKNSSAIVQSVGKEQEIRVSFLEPVTSSSNPKTDNTDVAIASEDAENKQSPPINPGAISNLLAAVAASASGLPSSTKDSLSHSQSTLKDGIETNNVDAMGPPSLKLLQQLQAQHQQLMSDDTSTSLHLPLPPLSSPPTHRSNSSTSPPSLTGRSNSLSPAAGGVVTTRYDSPSPSLASNQSATPGFPSLPQLSMMPQQQSHSTTPTNANMLQGTTIGACPEHINGRPTGVECVKCDLIISSSRMAGGSNWNMSRNSCKTLKCPKCNWHYKYQETLEIHMKEKHPESETTCIYCITGQQHPRLARGETYTCGYKPYKCEVCNYSTTTKGNLSIHMQSDKHLNNMQEIQASGAPMPNSSSSNDDANSSNTKIPPSSPSIPSRGSNGGHLASSQSQSMPPITNSNSISPSKLQQPPLSLSSHLPTSMPPLAPVSPQQKPNWRCDVCNYETNVARNLRIHMTSEKHTHNMMALQQQNVKNMQNLSASLGAMGAGGINPGLAGLSDPKQLLSLLAGVPPLGAGSNSTSANGQPEAALADLAFNQAVLAQLMSGGQAPGMPPVSASLPKLPPSPFMALQPNMPPEFNLAAALTQASTNTNLPGLMPLGNLNNDDGHNPLEPPPEPTDQNPKRLYTCCVCRSFDCDNLEDLSTHLSQDRSRTREHEVSIVIAGNYLCQLCNYKTNLKANFQLHCKTDKHLQRLSHVNHIKEGGPSNEWKLRFLTSINPVELRCNSCEFYSNSPHKLQVHTSGQQHQVSALLFAHLQRMEAGFGKGDGEGLLYNCALCKFSAKGKHGLLAHVRTMQHLQMEQIHQLQKRAEGNLGQTDIGDIFQVLDDSNESGRKTPSSIIAEDDDIRENNDTKNNNRNKADDDNDSIAETNPNDRDKMETDEKQCPLCQENFTSQESLNEHALSVHSVNAEGLARLQSLINGSHWLANKKDDKDNSKKNEDLTNHSSEERASKDCDGNESSDESDAKRARIDGKNISPNGSMGGGSNGGYSWEKYLDPNRPFKCEVCKESFTQKNILLVHYNSVSHLHRLKKSMDSQGKDSIPEAQPTPEKTPSKGSALEALLGNLGNRGGEKGNTKIGSIGVEDEEYKPFKCNICKVAYAQGSTLDIHVRSVLHQTKASKLQELILSGQIDMNKPLIEQPDAHSLQEQHKKMINDMLSPKSLNSTGSSGPQTSPTADSGRMNRTSSPSQRSSTPQSSPLATMMMNMKQQQGAVPGDGSSDSSPPGSLEHPKSSATSLPIIPGLTSSSPMNTDQKSSAPSPVLKNLLQNYGIDFTKPFGNNKLNSDAADNSEEMGDNKSEKDPRGTPSSIISNGAADRSTSRASASELNENGSKTTTPQKLLSPPESMPGIPEGLQEALRSAMMNAQLQQTLSNPLMMQMAQLSGGLNPLMAMNMHPPLIPPNLLKQVNNGGTNDNPAALLAQMFNPGSSNSPLPSQQLPCPPGMDPKLWALMQANRQKQTNESKDMNENKNQLAQMMNILQGGKGPSDMLNPFQPDPKNLLQLASKMGLNANKPPGIPHPQSSPVGGMKEKQQSHIGKPPQHPFAAPPPPGLGGPPLPPGLSSSPMPEPSLIMQQQSVGGGAATQQQDSKRARTRISDDQLKILRSNFDINNSPSEEALNKMAQQTGLPLKVIKHWFRNTLFKERQKNKDSPYNFNNAPTTKLNLEEYEKTGESKVTPLKPEDQAEYGVHQEKKANSDGDNMKRNCDSPVEEVSSNDDIKNEMKYEDSPDSPKKDNSFLSAIAYSQVPSFLTDSLKMAGSDEKGALNLSRLLALGAGGAGGNMPSLLPNFPAFPSLNLPTSSNSVFPNLPTSSASFPKLNLSSSSNSGLQLPASPVMPDQLNSILSKQNQQQRPLSPQSVSSQGKRANRTRFTDYQIKVLQEFFENNAYPKDDDLEYLSKLLGLSPRVIVVWFQNARQKARKVYENQPADGSSPNGAGNGSNISAGAEDEAAGRFTRTSSCNYQCKKCLLVFQRYYELIRHQKQHCYKEEDAKKSAQAQKAAAQAAAQFQGSSQSMNYSDDSNGAGGIDCERGSITSPACSRSSEGHDKGDDNRFSTEERIHPIPNQRNFEAEEAISKLMHPLSGLGAYPADSPFGILQQQGLLPGLPQHPIRSRSPITNEGNDGDLSGDDFLDSESGASSGGGNAAMTGTSNKRKHSLDDCDDVEGGDDLSDAALLHKDKRLRTTILPEQLDFLYQKYQNESNPSRKMLEQIAGDVGLRKRVVQVWFQNTRARERKGHFRPSQQFISKRCPFCTSIFKVRAALEAHLTSKHPDQPTSIVDIDALPNINSDDINSNEDGVEQINEKRRGSITNLQHPALPQSPFPMSEQIANLLPTGGSNPNAAFDLQSSMRKYYEDTMKRFMNDLGDASKRSGENMIPKSPQSITSPLLPSAPADLGTTYTFEDNMEDNHIGGDASDSDGHNKSVDADGNMLSNNKRFRTQMSGLQIKMMKAVFEVYKTPTMTECSNLGKDIGLQKRVVQVWFQNARAKEKRAKLQLNQATGGREGDIGAQFQTPTPDRCVVCPDFSYVEGKGCAVQDHIFTRNHLENLKVALEQGRYEPEAPGNAISQAAAAISGGNNGVMSSNSPPPSLSANIPSTRDSNALQMLQMATQSAAKATPNNGSLANELMEMSSMQNGRMLMQV